MIISINKFGMIKKTDLIPADEMNNTARKARSLKVNLLFSFGDEILSVKLLHSFSRIQQFLQKLFESLRS